MRQQRVVNTNFYPDNSMCLLVMGAKVRYIRSSLMLEAKSKEAKLSSLLCHLFFLCLVINKYLLRDSILLTSSFLLS